MSASEEIAAREDRATRRSAVDESTKIGTWITDNGGSKFVRMGRHFDVVELRGVAFARLRVEPTATRTCASGCGLYLGRAKTPTYWDAGHFLVATPEESTALDEIERAIERAAAEGSVPR